MSQSTLPFGEHVTLANGQLIPQLGFGVYEMNGAECRKAVRAALEAGYRHIDSAAWYGNERECGQSIRAFIDASHGRVTRQDIFYTSKLRSNSTYEAAQRAIQQSLVECGLGYLDLYLCHSPYPHAKAREASWRAMEDAVSAGLIRSIGVSNYGTRHVQELLDVPRLNIAPVVNQIDVHPFMTRVGDVAFCQDHGIQVEAWGPLVRGMKMRDRTLVKLADSKRKSVAQVLIRYSLQRGCIAIPKSVTPSRIVANKDVFDFTLTQEEMRVLSALNADLVTDWDPIGDSSV